MSKTPEESNKPAAAKFNWDLTLKIAAAVISAATLCFGIYQYVVKPKRDAAETLYKSKQELYNKAMESTAAFANASTQTEADTARKHFWELYYGKLGAVENAEVKQAMQTFGGAVKQWEDFNDPSDFTAPADFEYVPEGETKGVSFRDLSYRLTQACSRDLTNK
ncbi:MAG TPA: hypothetical protein VFY61_18710 [Pyrinomonadaceae bacterium]|nr:hypothetical protein [Pyrinomonadaceae bacterium]